MNLCLFIRYTNTVGGKNDNIFSRRPKDIPRLTWFVVREPPCAYVLYHILPPLTDDCFRIIIWSYDI